MHRQTQVSQYLPQPEPKDQVLSEVSEQAKNTISQSRYFPCPEQNYLQLPPGQPNEHKNHVGQRYNRHVQSEKQSLWPEMYFPAAQQSGIAVTRAKVEIMFKYSPH
jgi:hypothetical protein